MSVSKLTGSVLFVLVLLASRGGASEGAVYAVEAPKGEIVHVEISVPGPAFVLKGDPDEEVIEIDPDEISISPGKPQPSLWEQCRKAVAEDRGERLLCVTHVGEGLFQIILGGSPGETLWTLAVEPVGEADTFAGLYHRDGERLGGDSPRIVVDLEPGSYFVREDDGVAGGPYVLRVTASRW